MNKALLIQNQLNYLCKIIDSQKVRIDLLLIKPQLDRFIESYNYAKQILEKTLANKFVIEENQIENYTDMVVEEIEF